MAFSATLYPDDIFDSDYVYVNIIKIRFIKSGRSPVNLPARQVLNGNHLSRCISGSDPVIYTFFI